MKKEKMLATTGTEQALHEAFGRKGTGPLQGIVIADFSRVLAGPYCTMLLADMGATVIKVESPSGDDTRTWKPPVRGEDSTYYLSVNRNKLSIALDFRDDDELKIAQDIAARADVVVENFKPNSLSAFGLDFVSVEASNPCVIYASITGFGTGAGAGLPGYDLLVQAMSGMMSVTGSPDTSPMRSGVAIFDVITGLHTCIGILGALQHRTKTGEGQLIELNLLSSALSGMVNQTAAYVLSGVIPERMGNEHPSLYPYEPMMTGEGELVIAAGNDGQFRALCEALGVPEIALDSRFTTMSQRNAYRAELRPILTEQLASRSAADWFTILSSLGLPCAPIQDIQGGVETAIEFGLSPIVQAGSGEATVPTIRHPVQYSRTPVSYELAPPALNDSSQRIRSWLAGNKNLDDLTHTKEAL